MSRHFTCPQGHQWELSDTSSSLAAHLDPVCPRCGAPAQVSAPDLVGKSDSGSIRMALGPAPVAPRPRELVTAAKLEPPAPPRRSELREEIHAPAETKSWLRGPGIAAL